MSESEGFKREAAYAAVDRYVRSGMTVGLGTGSTAVWVVRRLGEKLASGDLKDVVGVPTSERTAGEARERGVPLATLAEARPDVTLDGADEISPEVNVIKGLGGALLREKIVAFASGSLVIVADGSKLVGRLGERTPVPVEVERFGADATLKALAALGCEPKLRPGEDGSPFITDGGNYTADCYFGEIEDPARLEAEIKSIPGALECGLFIGLARAAVVSDAGGLRVLEAR
ncbi:rpiA: ribose 5-phosphate isomerase A [Rubrobacter radiotolerans]|uniref:Ribose-5-phosphate isomerase A n=1 Tax=Rubrobacter radiotolerans TaxID=42256 RepID=A0A023X4P1_RUBRA|nr:ribose-5-phosphate isomerase RpiA [Rubrobacter radiotolerans]AHY47437.1 rpiA: ribose 5-phosphate isomerase A [Rubrobacter radiotolerans]MDX5894840.1 ribose-5-phosphate isomerase RpiA [Rubrobacter radiotolerans]SMC06880.1 ribose-5-phosphate isomerase [Rubrobacter radiotolerans DSM 5868]